MKWEAYKNVNTGHKIIIIYKDRTKSEYPSLEYARIFDFKDKEFDKYLGMLKKGINITNLDLSYNLVKERWFDFMGLLKEIWKEEYIILCDEVCDFETLRNIQWHM